MSLFNPYLVLVMPLSVLPPISTLPVVHAPMAHESTSLRRSYRGLTRMTPRMPRQYIGLLGWLDWARPLSPIRSASCLTKIACPLPPSSAHSSSTAGTRNSSSPLYAATLPNSIARMRPMFCQSWKQIQRLSTLACASKLTNYWSSRGKALLLRGKMDVYQHP